MEQNSLGSIIKEERKRKGLTQKQLGQMIGLKSARVSKIENGAPITPDVASFILGKLGSKLKISVVDEQKYNADKSRFLISAISNFSSKSNMDASRSYLYLLTFKGLDFLQEYEDIEQTLSDDEIYDDLIKVCRNNGGAI